MDKLNAYIQNGKQLTGNKLFLTFSGIALALALLFYIFTSVIIKNSEIQTVLQDIPTITIKNGIVQSPQTWEKEIPSLNLSLSIDASSDTPKIKKNNSVYLGKTRYIVMTQGINQEYIFQGFNGEITKNDIVNYLKKGMTQATLFIAVFILLFLYLGYYGTYFLSKCILILLKKTIIIGTLKRSSFVGWISVMMLNLILFFFNAGMGWLIAVPIASTIAVFCILKGNTESDS